MLSRLRLIQIGDIHLPSSSRAKPAVDNKDKRFPSDLKAILAAPPLKLAFQKISELCESGDIAAVIFMGDLTDFGDLNGYKACAAYIAKALQVGTYGQLSNLPIGLVPGNHDIDRQLAKDPNIFAKFLPLTAALSVEGLGR